MCFLLFPFLALLVGFQCAYRNKKGSEYGAFFEVICVCYCSVKFTGTL